MFQLLERLVLLSEADLRTFGMVAATVFPLSVASAAVVRVLLELPSTDAIIERHTPGRVLFEMQPLAWRRREGSQQGFFHASGRIRAPALDEQDNRRPARSRVVACPAANGCPLEEESTTLRQPG